MGFAHQERASWDKGDNVLEKHWLLMLFGALTVR